MAAKAAAIGGGAAAASAGGAGPLPAAAAASGRGGREEKRLPSGEAGGGRGRVCPEWETHSGAAGQHRGDATAGAAPPHLSCRRCRPAAAAVAAGALQVSPRRWSARHPPGGSANRISSRHQGHASSETPFPTARVVPSSALPPGDHHSTTHHQCYSRAPAANTPGRLLPVRRRRCRRWGRPCRRRRSPNRRPSHRGRRYHFCSRRGHTPSPLRRRRRPAVASGGLVGRTQWWRMCCRRWRC